MKYLNLLIMTILSFISMYILMYLMVDKFINVYPNLNQFYMAGAMTIPMVLIELALMGSMYPNKNFNLLIWTSGIIIFGLLIFFIRNQTIISDKEFLKSMIPHHAGALLMCEKAALKDPEVKQLCENILKSQQQEIDFMKSKLKNLNS